MKKIEIEIPEGKCAKWVNGVLILVDNKDITERIKTFEDACNALDDEHPLVTQYRLTAAAYKGDPMTEDFIAFLKLRIIAAALNEGWEPTFDKDEERWYPWFTVKQDGLVFAYAYCAGLSSNAGNGVRLFFKSKELAEYAGKQFIDIYKDFCYKTSNQMSKTYKHQATYDYLHGNKNVGKYLRGILRYFNRCNWPKWDGSRISWYKHKLFKQGIKED